MSPISVPERTIRQLIKMNSGFLFNTIYWEDPLAAYRYATIIPAWPLALDCIAFVLVLPNLKRPSLTPLYCTTSIGKLITHGLATCHRLPQKLIKLIDIKHLPLTSNRTNSMFIDVNITTDFAVPSLEQCRIIDDDLYACPAAVALTPWQCDNHTALCETEIKQHQADEVQITQHGYAVRSQAPCLIQTLKGDDTNILRVNGFAIVPFLNYGVLKCGVSIAVPL